MSFTEKAMAPHSSTLAWKMPWMEEPGGLQSMGSLRVGHDWATSLSLFTFVHWRRKWQPTPVFLPRESQGRGALWAAVYGVTQSWTWLKRLSSSNSSLTYLTSDSELQEGREGAKIGELKYTQPSTMARIMSRTDWVDSSSLHCWSTWKAFCKTLRWAVLLEIMNDFKYIENTIIGRHISTMQVTR